jgi:hypothetical protein
VRRAATDSAEQLQIWCSSAARGVGRGEGPDRPNPAPVARRATRRQQNARIKENEEKVKLNKALPYLVGNVVELLDAPEEVSRAAAIPSQQQLLQQCAYRRVLQIALPGISDFG